jgi:hypothetical protein
LATEEEVELIWKEFLDERKSIFTHDDLDHPRP